MNFLHRRYDFRWFYSDVHCIYSWQILFAFSIDPLPIASDMKNVHTKNGKKNHEINFSVWRILISSRFSSVCVHKPQIRFNTLNIKIKIKCDFFCRLGPVLLCSYVNIHEIFRVFFLYYVLIFLYIKAPEFGSIQHRPDDIKWRWYISMMNLEQAHVTHNSTFFYNLNSVLQCCSVVNIKPPIWSLLTFCFINIKMLCIINILNELGTNAQIKIDY